MSRRKGSAWPPAPSWATSCDRTSDDVWRYRLHWAMVGRIGLAGRGVEVTLVREDSRQGKGPAVVGPVEVAVTDATSADTFRLPLGDLGRDALLAALIEATEDVPRVGGVR